MNIEVFYNEDGKTFQEVMEAFLLQFCGDECTEIIEKYA